MKSPALTLLLASLAASLALGSCERPGAPKVGQTKAIRNEVVNVGEAQADPDQRGG